MHSANWDGKYDFRGKKAGVIGAGSSGIQIIPEIAKGTWASFPPKSSPLLLDSF
jgi:cation diffusion facilitator CzcD-associated flavoprotein CzcO